MLRAIFLLLVLQATVFGLNSVLHEWVQMNYDWESMGQDENQWISEGLFIAQNCILAGIKQWEDTIFVTIPRWAPGVPATLNRIVYNSQGIPLLQPFPPVENQMINTTNGLKNVQGKKSFNNSKFSGFLKIFKFSFGCTTL